MIRWLLVGLLVAGPASAQVTADVTLRNGRLVVWRDSAAGVHLMLDGVRRFGIEWPAVGGLSLGAVAAAFAVRAQATGMPADTQETVYRTAYATLTLRCGPAGCWATVTERGRGGYWRPAPDFGPAALLKLAAALDAAWKQDGGLWRETLP